jgi:hypothetical protein
MKKHLFLFTLLMAVLVLFSQNGNAQEKTDSVSRYDIHIMPFTILDYAPRYRIGFEYQANSHLGYVLDLGYGNSAISGFFDLGYIGDEYSLFEIRPALVQQ